LNVIEWMKYLNSSIVIGFIFLFLISFQFADTTKATWYLFVEIFEIPYPMLKNKNGTKTSVFGYEVWKVTEIHGKNRHFRTTPEKNCPPKRHIYWNKSYLNPSYVMKNSIPTVYQRQGNSKVLFSIILLLVHIWYCLKVI